MPKIDPVVKRETLYIGGCTAVGSLLMESVFLILQRWDWTVLLGNLFGGAAAIFNFFLMGLTVQSAVQKEAKQAAGAVKVSQSLRMVLLFSVAVVGVLAPCFQMWAVLIPLFFPRIGIQLRPLFQKEKNAPSE